MDSAIHDQQPLVDQIESARSLEPSSRQEELRRLQTNGRCGKYAQAYIHELLRRTYCESAPALAIYIFYHSESSLRRAFPQDIFYRLLGSPYASFVNLNHLEIPPEFRISGTSDNVNRAMLSEYLGICSIVPPADAQLVGCLTYSIPLKFSLAWAEETGNKNLFLPAFNPQSLLDLQGRLDSRFLYGVEFKSPFSDDLGPVYEASLRLSSPQISEVGPYKGTFICGRESFIGLQSYLKEQIPAVLAKDEKSLEGIVSLFDSSATADRPQGREIIDRRRHTYGTSLERLVALYFSTLYKEERMIDIRTSFLISQIEAKPWLLSALKAASRGIVTIVFCGYSYLKTLRLWLDYYSKTGSRNLVVFCLDRRTAEFCRLQKIAFYRVNVNLDDGLSPLWRKRLEIVSDLVEAGLSVILSDIDAVWLDNPTSDLFDPRFDIIATQGTVYPRNVYAKIGVVACCGLICFNHSPRSIRFLRQCLSDFDRFNDDQKAINNVLLDLGLSPDMSLANMPKTRLPIPDSNEYIDAIDADFIAKTNCGLAVKFLGHKRYQRLFDQASRPVISHILTPKIGSHKELLYELVSGYPGISSGTAQDHSSVVWLASYPRSGNTMLRGWISKHFSSKSFSIYNDVNDIARSDQISAQVGHQIRKWNFKHLHNPSGAELKSLEDHQSLSGLSYIKTHACYSDGYSRGKVIYMIRNGMDALSSHAHYRLDFGFDSGEDVATSHAEELSKIIVNGLPMCGYWSDNVSSWMDAARHNKNILVLKFESVISNPRKYLRIIREFTGASIVDYEPILFEDSKALNSRFFRKGTTNRESFGDPLMASLFYAFEGCGMVASGYSSQANRWFCVDRNGQFVNPDRQKLDIAETSALEFIVTAVNKASQSLHERQIKSRDLHIRAIVAMAQKRVEHLLLDRERQIIIDFADEMRSFLGSN